MKKIYLFLVLSCLSCLAQNAFGQSSTFNYTGATQTYVVPPSVFALAVDARGACGGSPYISCGTATSIAYGGRVQCYVAVTPGMSLYVYPGGLGTNEPCGTGTVYAGGFNGGQTNHSFASPSGGGTDIRLSVGTVSGTTVTPYTSAGVGYSNNRIIVAGGGGGGGDYNYIGGNGGGLTGGIGTIGYSSGGTPGSGGTQTGGGPNGTAGTLGIGAPYGSAYGGGGGGYWGGNSGISYGGGGGGSSYTDPNICFLPVHTQGYTSANGNGVVYISQAVPAVSSVPNPVPSFGPITVGATSPTQTFVLTGIALTAGGSGSLLITPPANFQIQPIIGGIPSGTWYTNSSPYTYAYPSSGFFAATSFLVQFLPTAISAYSANIVVTGGGLSAPFNLPVSGNGAAACSGSPTAGTASSIPTSGGPATVFTLSLAGTSIAGGLTYQWQESITGAAGTFVPIYGATNPTYTFSGLPFSTYFNCLVSCGSTSSSSTSQLITMAGAGAASCVPSFSNTCYVYPMNTSIASLTGTSGTLADPSNFGAVSATCPTNYIDNTAMASTTLNAGTSYTATLNIAGPPNNYYTSFSVQAWIDFNNDGTFQPSESVGGYALGTIPSAAPGCTFTIPAGVASGTFRMRIMGNYNSTGFTNYPAMNPCATGIAYGNARDYKITINGSAPSFPVGSVTASPTSLAFGSVTVGTSSAPDQFFTLNGANLTATSLSVTAPVGFSVSTDGVTWYPGPTTMPLAYTPGFPSGSLSNQNIYVQFNPTAVTSYSGNITITGGGVPSAVNVGVTGNGQAVCTGAPTPGTASANTVVAGPLSPITLSLTGTSAVGGLTYQWLSSATSGGTYTPIAGAITSTYSFVGISAAAFYECIVTCPSGSSATSNVVSVGFLSNPAATLCTTPTADFSCPTCPFVVAKAGYPFTIAGDVAPGINDATSVPSGYYADYTSSMYCVMHSGASYSAFIESGTGSYNNSVQIWIDFNSNGTFEASESVGGVNYLANGTVYTAPITIPAGIANGSYRLRVVVTYSCCGAPNYPPYPSIPACPNTTVYYDETRDYKVIFGPAPPTPVSPCAGIPNPGIADPSITSSCTPFTTSLFGVGEAIAFSGLNYQWQSSSSATGPWTSISGATGENYAPPLVSTVGTTYYRDSVTCINGFGNASTFPKPITLNPNPLAITGTFNVCSGLTTTLADASTGGVWASSNTANATVTSGGVVTGVTSGTVPTITYTLPTGGCFVTQPVTVNLQPAAISGTSPICGATTYTYSDATTGGVWSSSNTVIASVGSSTGIVTGGAPGGATTISYTSASGCSVTYAVTDNPLSVITGVPSMCLGFGTSLADATPGGAWSSANTGIATVNSSGAVTSVALGATTINYTTTAGCVAQLTVNVTNPPSTFTMTGGGNFCSGPSTVHVGINGSNLGISYQLVNTLTGAVGGLVTGTGFPIDFGAEPAGTYYVVANPGTPCSATMTGFSTVTALSLPTAYAVTGGGNYCPGGTGVNVFLNNSAIGINYQLFVGGVPVGTTVAGTNSPLNFGLQTTTGTYTVVATNPTTGCTNTMSGSAIVGLNAAPAPQTVTGGGQFCVGASGVLVGLSGSVVGTTYQLTLGGSPVGTPLAGTGSALSFGLVTTGGTYNVVATITATGCSATMSGTAVVVVNPLPTVFTVTGGGGYCATTTNGVPVGLNGSTIGVNYQLYYTPSGGATVTSGSPVPGTGSAITFTGGTGAGGTYTAAGSYSVVASNPTTGCNNNMFGSVSVFTNPLPLSFSVTGTANYCAGGTGVPVFLSGSQAGTTYQLFNGVTLTSAASGTGSAINFGTFTAAGTYTAVATTTATGCTAIMPGSAIITINPLPIAYNVVLTGASSYCQGATGVPVGLSGSNTGINYQLFNGTTPITPVVAGTGSPITFGPQLAGSYTVVASSTSPLPTCTANMTGSVSVTVNPVPTVYSVTGGGNYCSNALPAGMHVGLSGSNTGINYSIFRTGGAVLTSMPGIGGALDYGLESVVGTYKIAAANATTGCADTMSGSAVVGINTLPNATYSITTTTPGGAQYCAGGTGAGIGTSNSETGVNYQLLSAGFPTGAPLAGSAGVALNFGPQTGAGPYTVMAANAATTCSTLLTGSITVTINPLPAVVSITGGGGNYCGGTAGAPVGLSGSASGISYQLYNSGALAGGTVAGTGGVLSFGLEPFGTYTAVATNGVTGCSANMSGSAIINLNPAPVSSYAITGGGNYCTGGSGRLIGLSSSSPGISYQLMSLGLPVGTPMAGTGVSLSFGLITASGSYTVLGTNTATGCTATMTGTTTISINSLPTPFNVNGGGNYCPGTSGVLVGLSGSVLGTTYQLFNGSTAVAGGSVPGTGSPISFGLQTATGTYTVVANNGATTCTGNMTGAVTVGLSSLPVAYSITGGGQYCPGGTGVNVGLSGSNTGINYQLQNGAGLVGSAVPGTGFSLNFGPQTAAGTYTIVANNPTSTCNNNMAGTATVIISTPPTAFNVTGGGNYCQSGAGMHIGLDGSQTGTFYQLFNGAGTVGSPMPGTGSLLDFGAQTVPGTYTVVATSTSTTCSNTMAGSTTINILPLPSVFTVSTGGNYCAGSGGIDVMLASSQTGISYQLFNGATGLGTITGSGAALDFGNQTAAGTYTIVGTDMGSSCTNTMSGTSVIVVNPLPTAYIVSGGGNYCAGGAGVHIMLSGSNTGIHYQLMNGGPIGTAVAGTGSAIDFGPQTLAGGYTVVASNTATSCTNTMTGTVAVIVNTLPASYSVTSSASNYCAGGDGVEVDLSSSDAGMTYQLYNGSTTLGSPVPGTGFEISFGLQTLAGTYTVVAINPSTACNKTMTGAATIVVNPLPVAYTVTGGGNYCNGGSGVHVGISGSNTGISYQLYNGGGTAIGSAIMGTGLALDFGSQTLAGTYTVVATNAGTTCTNHMSGFATVGINPLPTVNTVTGGGNYCATGAGVHVGLNGSTAGVNYQLYNGVSLVGGPVAGTGIALDFGTQTAAGTYTVMAMNAASACSSSMAGSVSVVVNSLPSSYPVTGGGNYCPGGSGVHVGLGGSALGISYQLYNGASPIGGAMPGTGSALNFGAITLSGTYSVVATNAATTCTSNMSGSVSVGLNPLPAVYSVIGGGNYCAGGVGVHVGINGSATGINYQLYNGSATGFPVAGTGGPVDFGLQTAAGSYTVVAMNGTTTCSNNMSGSAVVVISPLVSPSVTLSTGVGDTVCAGRVVTISSTVANGGSAPIFSWTLNGSPVSGTGGTYAYTPADGDNIGVLMTSNATCATPPTVGNSLVLSVMANGNPTISVAATPGQIVCQGTPVTFNNFNTFGGTPTFTWIVNGSNVSTAPSYTYTPTNGDVVYAIMTSNYRCRLENTVTSNHITMEVDDSLLPVVTITAHPGTNISKGQSLTLTASVANGGGTPSYQWYVNGIAVPGATQASLTGSNYNNGDSVTCEVTSSGGCAGLQGFNSVRVVVNGITGVQQIANASGDIQLIPNPNKGIFTIKGTLGTTDDEEVSVEITNMLGQVIYTNKLMAHGGIINEKVQLSGTVANGMYVLSLRSASANDVFHVVIEQ